MIILLSVEATDLGGWRFLLDNDNMKTKLMIQQIRNQLSVHITPTPTQRQYSSFALTHHKETINST